MILGLSCIDTMCMVAFSNCIRFGFRLLFRKKQCDLLDAGLLVRWLLDCIYLFPWFCTVCIALGFE